MVKSEQPPEEAQQEPSAGPFPEPTAAFYQKLLGQPSCITAGICDNCGRCEH